MPDGISCTYSDAAKLADGTENDCAAACRVPCTGMDRRSCCNACVTHLWHNFILHQQRRVPAGRHVHLSQEAIKVDLYAGDVVWGPRPALRGQAGSGVVLPEQRSKTSSTYCFQNSGGNRACICQYYAPCSVDVGAHCDAVPLLNCCSEAPPFFNVIVHQSVCCTKQEIEHNRK